MSESLTIDPEFAQMSVEEIVKELRDLVDRLNRLQHVAGLLGASLTFKVLDITSMADQSLVHILQAAGPFPAAGGCR